MRHDLGSQAMALEDDYSGHKGFDPAFLCAGKADGRVVLPALGSALATQATTLFASPKETVLRYRNFSVVMHRIRRFAIYSAANVDFKGRYELADPRIAGASTRASLPRCRWESPSTATTPSIVAT
jgi:hypothetical protein